MTYDAFTITNESTAPMLDAAISNLSDEQSAIAAQVAKGDRNILVIARAGTGKTYTIRKCLPLMKGTTAIAAYNSKIVKEMVAKVAEDGSSADVATFHSFGYRALRRAYPKAKIEGKGPKSYGRVKFDVICEKLEIPEFLQSFVKKAMSLAMQSGFGVLKPLNDPQSWLSMVAHYDIDSELGADNQTGNAQDRLELVQTGCRFAARAVKLGMQIVHEVISFDDMIYMPLVLNLRLDTFDWICVDEAQDSNALRREMARRMTKPATGRMLWVGDDKQAIYGFTGADNDALRQIGADFDCVVLPLTVTRRCAKSVVKLAQAIVPDYKAYEGNAEGLVECTDEDGFVAYNLVPGDDAIICRNTAPLVKAAYSIIARGVPAHVEGKEIGKGLLVLVNKFGRKAASVDDLREKLADYRDAEVQVLTLQKKDAAADALNDKIETIFQIMATLPITATIDTLRQDISSLFADTPDGERPASVVLMTAHRSKGLEFKRVFGWGAKKFFPSKFAKQDWQLEQESNLEYVMITRAIETYVEVEVA